LSSLHFNDETILLKGARIFRFEKISHALEQKMHETILEINLNALRNNLKQYNQLLNKEVKLMAMVKAFSYGSGSYEIASLLQHANVDYLAVAYADEGVALRRSGIRLPIMVMNTEEAGFNNIIEYQLEPELYSFNILNSFVLHLQLHHINNYPVHIKLDTGMHRLGFEQTDIEALCTILSGSQELKIRSVFSHLVASDEKEHDAFTDMQAASFLKMSRQIEQSTGYSFLKHIANTSAIHRHPKLQFDMVRLGIGLYGVDTHFKLQNVTTLKTTISQIRAVKKGESVGYSRKGIVSKDSVIATVRIGYADGYPRILGNGNGKMLLNDQLVPVIGNVCMDMTMLDITGIEAGEGDEVIVFGERLPVTKVSAWANTIPYEILTNISQRVKRIYYEE
jgi:alanine racemase